MHDDITQLLLQRRLQEALERLQTAFYASPTPLPWEMQKELADIRTAWGYLLDYFRQGAADPRRDDVCDALIARALTLGDRLTLLRTGHRECPPLTMFDDVAAPSLWTSAAEAEAREIVESPSRSDDPKGPLFVSAVTLSLLQLFDVRKVLFLCDLVRHDDPSVVVRAVTALSLCLRRHAPRLPFYPDVTARLAELARDDAFIDALTDVELMLLRSRDTEEIERRMRDEIIPAMLRNPKLKDKPIITTDDLRDPEGPDPDWQRWLEESGVEESLRELTEMQTNGADIYLCTFAQLKSYPFFAQLKNWFLPFRTSHPDVQPLLEGDATLLRLILRSPTFCNSDKYSFCFTLRQLPPSQLELLRSQFQEQQQALDEEQRTSLEALTQPASVSMRTLTRQYVQDLYRFFYLHPRRAPYGNPFAEYAPFGTTLFAFPLASLRQLSELNIRRRDYALALPFLEQIRDRFPQEADATLFRKLGYCYQQTGRHDEALEVLSLADILEPDRYWTLVHLARSYRESGRPAEALAHYRRAAALQPDNLQLDYRQARLLMTLGQPDEASRLLFKLVYHEPANARYLRHLVRCLLLTGRADAAVRHADALLGTPHAQLTDQDFHDAGLALWLDGRRDEALAVWSEADALAFDTPTLTAAGIPSTDIPYLQQLLQHYKAEL